MIKGDIKKENATEKSNRKEQPGPTASSRHNRSVAAGGDLHKVTHGKSETTV